MRTVGVLEAKTRLSELVAQAAAGEPVTITRHGKPVAQLVPYGGRSAVADAERRRAVDRLLALPRARLRGVTIRELIREGRKY